MSRIVKVFQTLRNHWKKSVFFTGLTVWGAHFGHGKYLEFHLMKAYCQEAVKYGQEKIDPIAKARHVTVLLNPVANKRKGKADYEKYCAPLFHLAGLRVSLVITEEEGQIKDLMEIMDNTDCVVVAGGDGSVHEAITGLLRRDDSQNAMKQFPIGILPIGKNNSIVHKLNSEIYDIKKDMKAKILAESSMAVIRQTLNKVDVMKIEGERGRPVYSLGELSMGQLQCIINKVDQYWYLGQRMKPYLAFFFQSFKDLTSQWDNKNEISIEYTAPCSGCSKCYQRFEKTDPTKVVPEPVQPVKRWWYSFIPRSKTPTPVDPVLEAQKLIINKMKATENEQCDQWRKLTVKSKNISVHDTLDNAIELKIHPEEMDRFEFVGEGVRMFRKEIPELVQVIKAKECKIRSMFDQIKKDKAENDQVYYQNVIQTEAFTSGHKPNVFAERVNEVYRPNAIKELDDGNSIDANDNNDSNMKPEPDDSGKGNAQIERLEQQQWISIDNENYEIQQQIEISLLPRSVQIYHGFTSKTNQG